MKNSRTALALFALLFFSNNSLFAQPGLTARPSPHCRSFFITEFGYGYKATSPLKQKHYSMLGDSTRVYENEISGRHLLTSELGLMHNLNSDYGLGVTHFFGWDVGHNLRGGVKLRVRKWLSQKASIDVSGGALLWGTDGEGFAYPGFVGGASLNFSDWESLNLTVTTLQTQPYDYTYYDYEGVRASSYSLRQREIGVYIGYKFSSKPGLALNVAALTAFAVIAAAFIASGPYD